jgi:L-threonylcarbamoyladenylate synthase
MKIFDFKNKINEQELVVAADEIRNGNLVIFPTETVYGIGANALDEKAVKKIFIAKGRQSDNPLIVHISNLDMVEKLATDISDMERKLIDAFFPGPFTIVLKKKDIIPTSVTANLDTVGIRMPENNIALKLIEAAGVAIAAPSANISGRPSGTRIDDIKDEFDGIIDIMIDGGDTLIGLESTVVKVINNIPVILRPGKITPEDIIEIVGVVKFDEHIYKKSEGKVESPGMKYRHYAPTTECLLIYSDEDATQIDLVNANIKENTIVIGYEEHKNMIKTNNFYSFGSIKNYDEISHNIFNLLRKSDKRHADLIIIEGVKKQGLGIAIMNRLIRAANYNYIEK